MSDAHDRLAGLDSTRLAQLAAEHPDAESVATCDVCGNVEHTAEQLAACVASALADGDAR